MKKLLIALVLVVITAFPSTGPDITRNVYADMAMAKHEAGGGSLFWEQTPAYLNNVNAPPGWGPNRESDNQ